VYVINCKRDKALVLGEATGTWEPCILFYFTVNLKLLLKTKTTEKREESWGRSGDLIRHISSQEPTFIKQVGLAQLHHHYGWDLWTSDCIILLHEAFPMCVFSSNKQKQKRELIDSLRTSSPFLVSCH
jgi:hypothetical protein